MPKSKRRAKKSGTGKAKGPEEASGKNPMASDQQARKGYSGEFSAGARQQAHRRDPATFKRSTRGR